MTTFSGSIQQYHADIWAVFFPPVSIHYNDLEPGGTKPAGGETTGLLGNMPQLGSMFMTGFVNEEVDIRWFGAKDVAMDWGDSTGSTGYTHTYTTPGLYFITTKAGSGDVKACRQIHILHRANQGPYVSPGNPAGFTAATQPIFLHNNPYPIVLDPTTEGRIDGPFGMKFSVPMTGNYIQDNYVGVTSKQCGIAIFAETYTAGVKDPGITMIAGGFMTNRGLTLDDHRDVFRGVAYDPLYWLNQQFMREMQFDDIGIIGMNVAQQDALQNAPPFNTVVLGGSTVTWDQFAKNIATYQAEYPSAIIYGNANGGDDTSTRPYSWAELNDLASTYNSGGVMGDASKMIDYTALGYVPNHFLKACRPDYAAAHILQHIRVKMTYTIGTTTVSSPPMYNYPVATAYGTLAQFMNIETDPEFDEINALGGFHAFSAGQGMVLPNVRQILDNSGSIFYSKSKMSLAMEQKPYYRFQQKATKLQITLDDAIKPVDIQEGNPVDIYQVIVEKPILGINLSDIPTAVDTTTGTQVTAQQLGEWHVQNCGWNPAHTPSGDCGGGVNMGAVPGMLQNIYRNSLSSQQGEQPIKDALTQSVDPNLFLYKYTCGEPGGLIIGPLTDVFTDDLQAFAAGVAKEKSAHWTITLPLGNIYDIDLGDIVEVSIQRYNGLALNWASKKFWVTSLRLYATPTKHTRQVTLLEVDPDIQPIGQTDETTSQGTVSTANNACANLPRPAAPTGFTITSTSTSLGFDADQYNISFTWDAVDMSAFNARGVSWRYKVRRNGIDYFWGSTTASASTGYRAGATETVEWSVIVSTDCGDSLPSNVKTTTGSTIN